MKQSRQNKHARVAAAAVLLIFALSGCIPGAVEEGRGAASTPRRQGTVINHTPTPEMAGYQVVATPPVCPTVVLKSIKTSIGQGNTFAWSPDGTRLAWIMPTEAHQWFAGSLMVASGPDFSDPVMLAQNASGSVTWSPDGEKLGFSVLRVSEGVYTIMSINADGSGLKDLFAGQAARVDGFSSPKVITSWNSPRRMNVLLECGSGCLKTAVIDPESGVIQQETDAGNMDATRAWRPERNERSYDPADYPEMIDANMSEDGKLTTYFDANGYLWILMTPEQKAFRVDIENYTPIFTNQEGNRETHWSIQNWLGVRIDDHLEVFPVPCAAGSTSN